MKAHLRGSILNSNVSTNRIEFVVYKLPIQKTPDPDSFISEFFQPFEEETILILHKLIQDLEENLVSQPKI